jgi:hypothetical protein
MRLADRRKALLVVLGSLLVTGGLVALVLSLGSWAYQTRRFLLHERRLSKVLEAHPTVADLSTALLAEPGTRVIEVPRSTEDLIALTSEWSGAQREEILAKRRAARDMRIFEVGGVLYVLFFDGDGRLQGYLLLNS